MTEVTIRINGLRALFDISCQTCLQIERDSPRGLCPASERGFKRRLTLLISVSIT